MTTKKTPCDTRRCRKEGTHKVGMFHFCDKHYEEFCGHLKEKK